VGFSWAVASIGRSDVLSWKMIPNMNYGWADRKHCSVQVAGGLYWKKNLGQGLLVLVDVDDIMRSYETE